MRIEDPARRSRRILRLRSRVFLPWCFRVFFAVVFSGLLGESSSHSKVSVVWNIEEVFHSFNYSKDQGVFRAFSEILAPKTLYITLG